MIIQILISTFISTIVIIILTGIFDYFCNSLKKTYYCEIDKEICQLMREEADTKISERLNGWDTLLELRKRLKKYE